MIFLGSGFTWFNLVPGYNEFEHSVAPMFGHTVLEGQLVSSITHLTLSVLSTLIIVLAVMLTRSRWASGNAVEPDGRVTVRDFIEIILDTAISLGETVFGSRKTAKRFLPLIGTLALYILFHNLLGLIPGFSSATDNLNVTIGPAIVVFLTTHIWGIRTNGMHYFAHFLGPKFFGFYWLAPLMLVIEGISHLVRPLSLGMRLMGNMTGDHAVLAIFLGLAAVPLVYPLPFVVLGTLVCVVQTLVFSLLSMVYIALAIEHSEEAH